MTPLRIISNGCISGLCGEEVDNPIELGDVDDVIMDDVDVVVVFDGGNDLIDLSNVVDR